MTIEKGRVRGVYPIIDTAACGRAGIAPERLAEAIARAEGVRIAQFRHKEAYTRDVFRQAEEVGRILRAAGVAYVINDRADVALMVDADGVHVGQEDLPPGSVRGMVGSRLLIGYSTHTAEQMREVEGKPVDYVAFGPVFATGSKEKADAVVGIVGLREARRLTRKPLVAIGGITRENVVAVLEAGADAVAVISDLVGADLDGRLREWLQLTRR